MSICAQKDQYSLSLSELRNYQSSMELCTTLNVGDSCTCIRCKNCLDTKLESVTCDQLLRESCCDDDADAVPLLCCVANDCFSADCFTVRVERILRLRGCSTFKLAPHDDALVPYSIWGIQTTW